MINNVIEIILFFLMTIIYFIADKQYLLKSTLFERSLRSARGRPVGRQMVRWQPHRYYWRLFNSRLRFVSISLSPMEVMNNEEYIKQSISQNR